VTAVEACAYARRQVGKPYVWDTAGPLTFDCSGLTMRCAGIEGLELPHNAALQGRSFAASGRLHPVVRSSLRGMRPGDVLFYYGSFAEPATFTHCAFYVHRTRFRSHWVVAAVDEQLGVMYHRMRRFLSPSAIGYVGHD
jgi:cell wall-associated NlpC family hydrolase